MATALRPIGMLWVEGTLSYIEQLCLLSFLDQGHEVHLFHYGPIDGVPQGVILRDAREIHDPDRILTNRFGSPSMQADIFRLHLMRKTDMIWADSDVYCLRPIDPGTDYIVGDQGGGTICNAVMALPTDSETFKAYEAFVADEYPIPPWVDDARRAELLEAKAAGRPKHASQFGHSIFGPQALTWFLRSTGEIAHAARPAVYFPVPFRKAGELASLPAKELRAKYFDDGTTCVHLWGRRIRWWVRGEGRLLPNSLLG